MKINLKIFGILFIFTIILFSCGENKINSEDYWRSEAKSPEQINRSVQAINAEDSLITEIISPFLKEGYAKFRIGIIISGEYWEFFDEIEGILEGFTNIGWAKNIDIPLSIKNSYQLIEWLSYQEYSDYIEFPVEHFYDLEWGDNAVFVEDRVVNQKPDVDLFLVYGGMADRFLYNQEDYPIPVIANAITDTFAAGVTMTETDSGKDFFTNKIDIEQFKRQLRLFHDIVRFNTIGIVYGDDEYGIIYGAANRVILDG